MTLLLADSRCKDFNKILEEWYETVFYVEPILSATHLKLFGFFLCGRILCREDQTYDISDMKFKKQVDEREAGCLCCFLSNTTNG